MAYCDELLLLFGESVDCLFDEEEEEDLEEKLLVEKAEEKGLE